MSERLSDANLDAYYDAFNELAGHQLPWFGEPYEHVVELGESGA